MLESAAAGGGQGGGGGGGGAVVLVIGAGDATAVGVTAAGVGRGVTVGSTRVVGATVIVSGTEDSDDLLLVAEIAAGVVEGLTLLLLFGNVKAADGAMPNAPPLEPSNKRSFAMPANKNKN